jgi:hypothetical protein
MNEHRRKVLEMLAQGQINADEAERLLNTLEKEAEPSPQPRPKYIRVTVTEDGKAADGSTVEGATKVNVRVPMQLLRAGVKLASFIPPEARERVNIALRKDGVPIDLGQIKPENLEELIDHLDDLTVDIDERKKNTKVRVFCE